MKALHPLLEKYDTVLLDMDGVVTSEQIYWNTAALTVWEMLHSDKYFGTETIHPAELVQRLPEIRAKVFSDDALIKVMKTRGVNNNWDLAWLVIGSALILGSEDYGRIYTMLKTFPPASEGLYKTLSEGLVRHAGMSEQEAAQLQGLWLSVQICFQEWFLGSELMPQYWHHATVQPDKAGLSFSEEPIVDKAKLIQLLKAIGMTRRLGVGSGRPAVEAKNPLVAWGVWDYFASDAIITYNDVIEAQNAFAAEQPGLSLAKPHPYMFLRGVFGRRYQDRELLTGQYNTEACAKTLVIGDAACDMLSAKAAGCDFAAVLTGIEGEQARGFFEGENADYILHNILDLLEA